MFQYEEELYPIYQAKSKKYKKKNDFMSFLLLKSNINNFAEDLSRNILEYKFPPFAEFSLS